MADVYFVNLDDTERSNYISKLGLMCERLKLKDKIQKDEFVAIKLHMGERGNTAFIPPWYVKYFVDYVKELGAKPFITDTNVLYRGARTNAVDHLSSASAHGFNYSTFGAPIIIADGLLGNSGVKVPIEGTQLKEVDIANALYNADNIICLSHFKGHMLTGVGGALKNLGMGGGTRGGKMEMHCLARPFVVEKKCTACGRCIQYCPADAIFMDNEKAKINKDKCIGCADCIAVCRFEAVQFNWDASSRDVQEKMVDYFAGAVKNKKDKVFYFNFLTQITPLCDCFTFSSEVLTKDIGILSSLDPVAIDKASLKLINKAIGKDIFKELFPNFDMNIQFKCAERLSLGSANYNLKDLTKNQPQSSLFKKQTN